MISQVNPWETVPAPISTTDAILLPRKYQRNSYKLGTTIEEEEELKGVSNDF